MDGGNLPGLFPRRRQNRVSPLINTAAEIDDIRARYTWRGIHGLYAATFAATPTLTSTATTNPGWLAGHRLLRPDRQRGVRPRPLPGRCPQPRPAAGRPDHQDHLQEIIQAVEYLRSTGCGLP